MRKKRHKNANSVRIIGGKWRRQRLKIPADSAVRPTPDRVRETLFNWLEPVLPGARCLDLFAGTGALGFEALSRGAGQVSFVDDDQKLINTLISQRDTFDCEATVTEVDALKYLRSPVSETFDVVFMDPPYERPLEPLLNALEGWLESDSLVYIERSVESGLPLDDRIQWRRKSKAGAVCFGLASFDSLPAPKVGTEAK